jgi:hypothetical protein
MYLLGKEKERLERELASLDERRARIQDHLAAIAEELMKHQQVAQREETGKMADGAGVEATAIPVKPSPGEAQPRWTTVSLDY